MKCFDQNKFEALIEVAAASLYYFIVAEIACHGASDLLIIVM
jgi:hypothetical protein